MAGKLEQEDASDLGERLARAIGHPLRVDILTELQKGPMSPNEFAERGTDAPLPIVAYHFRVLAKCEAIALVDEQRRRGAIEHYYELRVRQFFSAEEKNRLPAVLRDGLSATTLRHFMRQAEDAVQAGTFDSHDSRHLSWTPLELDEEGFETAMGMLDELWERLGVIQLAARERLAKTGEVAVHTTVGMAGFESPAPVRDHDLPRSP